MPKLGIHLIPFLSLTFLDCKIVECLWNIVCIHRYLLLKSNQHGVAFYLNCIRMYKPRYVLQAPLNVLYFPVCTRCQGLLLGEEEMLFSNPPPYSELCLFLLWKQQCWLQFISVSQGLGPGVQDKRIWESRLRLFPAGTPSCSFVTALALLSLLLSLLDTRGCTLRCSKDMF